MTTSTLEAMVQDLAGVCPMMYGNGVDFGHVCMRGILGLAGGLPA